MRNDQSPATSRDATPTPTDPDERRLLTATSGAQQAAPVQQALAFSPAPVRETGIAARASRPGPLWLGIHFPALPLEVLHEREDTTAGAVFEEQQGIRRILLANGAAEKQGIRAGLSINAALALVPGLRLMAREPAREARVLENLATRAGRFTPLVSLEEPDVLLLEIAGSSGLFGGRDALRQQVADDLAGRSFTFSLSMAPTPLASLWLARSGRQESVPYPEHLVGVLGPLPLDCLDWPASVCESLNGMGIRSIGECLRLPRQGFARRFGTARLLQLDRALGRLPDPRASYRPPERFSSDEELPEEQSDRELLLAACHRLLGKLERFLVRRQVVVQRLEFVFFHLAGTATRLTLGCLRPEYEAGRWFELLGMKLDRLSLPAPVITIRLRSGQPQPLDAIPGSLSFDRGAGEGSRPSVTHLMERLAARIGDDGVYGVSAVAEHRPHRAWSAIRANGEKIPQCVVPASAWYERRAPQQLADQAGSRQTGRLVLRRPLWLLAEPLRLVVERTVPQYHGALRLQGGPERLETGWWDGNNIARDYFVAVNPKGMRLWIYRVRDHDAAWYLHGMFA